MKTLSNGGLAGLVTLTLVGLTACAGKVDQEQYNDEISEIRSTLEDHDSRISSNASAIDDLEGRVSQLERDLRDLEQNFQARITELENGLKFAMPVHFEFDKADIRSVDRPVLDRFASVAKEYYSNALITVEGFADPAGSDAYNVRLSQNRAQAVKDYLVNQAGMDGERLKTVGYGEVQNRQVKPGEQGPGRSGLENRRVTFVVEFSGDLGG